MIFLKKLFFIIGGTALGAIIGYIIQNAEEVDNLGIIGGIIGFIIAIRNSRKFNMKAKRKIDKAGVRWNYNCPRCGAHENRRLACPSTCFTCGAELPFEACSWNCPNCGTIHSYGVYTCTCGFDYNLHALNPM